MARKNKHKLKIIVLIGIALVIGVVGVVVLWQRSLDYKITKAPTNTSNSDLAKAEKQDVVQNKSDITNQKKSSPTSQTNTSAGSTNMPGTASVMISYAGQTNQTIQVSSYVSNVFEDGGTCTLTLTKGNSTVTRTVQGVANVSYTTCPTFSIENSGHSALAAGSWNIVVSYKSAAFNGSSETRTVDVQ